MKSQDLKELKNKLAKLSDAQWVERKKYLRKIALGEIYGPMVGNATIDRPWLKNYGEEEMATTRSMESPYDQFMKICEKYKDEVYYTYIADDSLKPVNLTFGEIANEIKKIQKSLLSIGCKPGDKIMAILPNTPEAKHLMWAAFNLGVVIYPISPLLPDKVLNEIVKKHDFNNLFIYEGFMDKFKDTISNNINKFNNIITFTGIESLNPIIQIMYRLKKPAKVIDKNKEITYKQFINKGRTCKVDIDKVYEYNEENTMLIEGTSGTTGVPKGVEICGRMINTTYASHSDSFIKFEHGDTYYDLMNNSLAYGATSAIMTALRGVHTVFRPGFTMDPYDDIMKYDVNQVIAGPVHVKNLNKHIENGDPVPKVKNWVSGGAPLDRKLEATVNKVDEQGVVHTDDGKPIVTQGYGATENQGVIAYEAADCYEYGAMGIPLLMENVGVFKTDTDEELGYNQEGEICISGDSIMNRYFDNPEETNKVLITHSDGTRWLHMKDLGSIDENGHLIFADRIKNIFQRNGMNVHPAKVTDFIKSIDIVDDCIVTGVQHPEEQCVPVAFIKLRSDIDNLEDAIDYINAACYKNLEESSIPYEIRFVENIPVNGGGKPDVRYLLETCGINYYDQKAQRKRILSIEKVNTFKL